MLPRQRPLGRAVGRAPVIVETPDGTQTVFIRDRGVNLPNWSSNRNTPANRRGSGSLGRYSASEFMSGMTLLDVISN